MKCRAIEPWADALENSFFHLLPNPLPTNVMVIVASTPSSTPFYDLSVTLDSSPVCLKMDCGYQSNFMLFCCVWVKSCNSITWTSLRVPKKTKYLNKISINYLWTVGKP